MNLERRGRLLFLSIVGEKKIRSERLVTKILDDKAQPQIGLQGPGKSWVMTCEKLQQTRIRSCHPAPASQKRKQSVQMH